MDQIREKRFNLDDSIKFWNNYIELTPDDRFVISGETTDFTNTSTAEDQFFGHIIGLDPNGSPSTSLTGKQPDILLFSILGNMVSDQLVVEKSDVNERKYTIYILDQMGKIISSHSNWDDKRMEVNVSGLTQGTFICQITEGNQIKYTGKFVKI